MYNSAGRTAWPLTNAISMLVRYKTIDKTNKINKKHLYSHPLAISVISDISFLESQSKNIL